MIPIDRKGEGYPSKNPKQSQIGRDHAKSAGRAIHTSHTPKFTLNPPLHSMVKVNAPCWVIEPAVAVTVML
jgi:hypothetical protein